MSYLLRLLLGTSAFLFSVGIAYTSSEGPPGNPTHFIALYENGALKKAGN